MKPISITSMMRRISAVALLLFLCASAFAFKDGSYTFSVNSDGESVTITSHDDKNATSIWIPSTAYDADKEKSYDVTAIGSNVFRNYLDLTSITFLASIEYIGQNAFSGCLQLEEFYVPSSVKTLATGVFQGCRSLHSVTLNAGLINLGENSYPYTGVFEDCSSLKEVKLPGTVKYVGSNTFGNCTSLESVDLNYGLLTIGSNAFYNCSSLNKIVIPNTVQEIGSAIFQGCNILEDATIGSKVQSMGNGIFSNCNSLNKVTIENGCSIIGQETFSGCSSLKTIVIPGTVKYINMGAFRDCTSLESVILNEGILYIGEDSYPYTGVFQGCLQLSYIYIPSTIKSIKSNTFYGCANLRRFISNASIVPELSNNIWANSSQARATLYVPFDALADYQAAAQWQDFKNIRAIGDEGGEDVYGTCDLVDVPFNSPYFDAVEFLCERGVLNGSGMDGRVSV